MMQYISDSDHYNEVLKASFNAKKLLWIGTADLKDLHVKYRSVYVPYFKVLSEAFNRHVSVRLIH
ncbi:MAG: phospholipase, partial [Candidatus Delongbacteria bacterium]|nr:phospholipase [Candidatus Delongbacteria bacterium]